MKATNLCALGAIALLTLPIAGCGNGEAAGTTVDETSVEAAPLPVQVVSAEVADIFATYKTTATIAADSEAPILARVAGEVVEILVEEGDSVQKGQLLARLDGDRLRLEMLEAKAELEKTLREFERTTSLHERGLISSAAYEGLEFDLAAQRASYELKRLNHGYTEIRATIPGVISARNVKIGTQIAEGQSAFNITDTSRLVAYLTIPQTELHKFSAGHEAIVSVDSAPAEPFTATIARLSPTIDTTSGTFRATAYIDNTDGGLAPGMFGRFTIAYEKHSDAIVVPAVAVVREDSEAIVYIIEDGAAVRRPVLIGIESDGMLEIVSGLAPTDSIVLSGQSRLRDGSRVLASTGNSPTDISG